MTFKSLFQQKTIASILEHADGKDSNYVKPNKTLTVKDLTAMSIAAIVGAGIFSTIGGAASQGGPAVALLFVFTAIACGFSAMCYAQFAGSIPVSGSAYTYAYASLGELFAWIIGWDLIIEYAIGNVAVAISWSDYFTALLHGFGLDIPAYLTTDYLSAFRNFNQATTNISQNIEVSTWTYALNEGYTAWTTAPQLFGIRLIADIPAFSVVTAITVLVFIGIYESKIASNLMVLLKLAILFVVMAIGSFYVNPHNWDPFAPNGLGGVLKGISGVFFAYIGFDAISTTAEECKNPQRDLPRAMVYSLIITTVLYVLISLVLTGMVSYKELAVGDPLAYVFQKLDLLKLSGIVAIGAVIAMASVLLVFQVGQPRIWMSMSRDGLLPSIFSRMHPRFKTPWFSTIVTGLLVAIPTLFMNITEMTDLTSIGTLFAFVLVSSGVLFLDSRTNSPFQKKGFQIPYINSRYYLPVIIIFISIILYIWLLEPIKQFFDFQNIAWEQFKHKIPTLLFIIIASVISYYAIVKKFSLIPVMGLLTNLYLMSELGITNWLRFLLWLLIGLVIYFTYGVRHSKLRMQNKKY